MAPCILVGPFHHTCTSYTSCCPLTLSYPPSFPQLLPATLFERVAYFATPVPSPHVRPLQARLRQPSPLTPPRTQSPSKTDERALDKSSSDDEVKPK